MSARKRNQQLAVRQDIDNIWQQDLKESKPHKAHYQLSTRISKFQHVQPLLEVSELLPSKKKN